MALVPTPAAAKFNPGEQRIVYHKLRPSVKNTVGAASPPPQMFGCLGVWIRSSSTIHHSPLILHTFPRQVRRSPPQARSGDTVLRVPHAQREGYRTARSEFHKYAWHTCGHAGAFGTRRSASASICRRVATPPAGEISTHDFQSHPTPKPLT